MDSVDTDVRGDVVGVAHHTESHNGIVGVSYLHIEIDMQV